MSKRIQELQQNQQLLQKERDDLKRTNKSLLESVKSHEFSLLHVQADLKATTERLDAHEKQLKTCASRAEHDRGSNKKEFKDVYASLRNIFALLAKQETDMEGAAVREVARDELLGLVTDVNGRLNAAESVSYGLTPLVRALCETEAPELHARLPPLPRVTHDYWGRVVPVNEWTGYNSTSCKPPQFPEDGVANAFPVPAEVPVPAPEGDEVES
eukprot:2132235-Amphidinium_carterae.2